MEKTTFILFSLLIWGCSTRQNQVYYIYEWSVSRYNDIEIQNLTKEIYKIDSLIQDTVLIETGKSLTKNYLLQVIHSIEKNWQFNDFETDEARNIIFYDSSYLSGISSAYDTYCTFGDSVYKIRNYFSYLRYPANSGNLNELNIYFTPSFGIFMFSFMHNPNIYKLERVIQIERSNEKVILNLEHIPILLCDTSQLYFLSNN